MTLERDILALLQDAPAPDLVARSAVQARIEDILRPMGALNRLDRVAAWLAAWQGKARPSVSAPALLLAAGDHGVLAQGVSAYPAAVTGAMVAAIQDEVATSTAFAKAVGASVHLVDAGVGRPTEDMTTTPAMDDERFADAVSRGREAVRALPAEVDLLILGEMGIGNTTAAAAVSAALFGDEDLSGAEALDLWVGRGAGVDDEGLTRKMDAVRRAVTRTRAAHPQLSPLTALREVGGLELAALLGATLEARMRRLPVVLDGYIVTAAVAPLHVLHAGALDHCLAGHRSVEPGHTRLLAKLDKAPLLDLDMRLGEGSGALAAVPLIRLALAGVFDVATFSERGLR